MAIITLTLDDDIAEDIFGEDSFEQCAQDFAVLASMMLDFVAPEDLRARLEVEIERHGKAEN